MNHIDKGEFDSSFPYLGQALKALATMLQPQADPRQTVTSPKHQLMTPFTSNKKEDILVRLL